MGVGRARRDLYSGRGVGRVRVTASDGDGIGCVTVSVAVVIGFILGLGCRDPQSFGWRCRWGSWGQHEVLVYPTYNVHQYELGTLSKVVTLVIE